jgi:hypothetical protein
MPRIVPRSGRSLYLIGVFVALVGFFAEQARCSMRAQEPAADEAKPADKTPAATTRSRRDAPGHSGAIGLAASYDITGP